MAAPTVITGSAGGNSTGPSTGCMVPWPAGHQVDDICLVVATSPNESPLTLSTPAGFVEITNIGQGTALAATACNVYAWWCRATSTSMSAPVIANATSGAQTYRHAFSVIIRGCITTGDPFDTFSSNTSAATTAISVPGLTTSVADCTVVAICADSRDSNTSNLSGGWTNASLSGVANVFDFSTNIGNGGGLYAGYGEKAAAGAVSATTATLGVSSTQARICIAFKPPAGSTTTTASSTGTGTATGIGASTAAATAATTGTGTATGVGASSATTTASSSGTGTATGLSQASTGTTASAAGSSVATGLGASTWRALGASTGDSTVTGLSSFEVVAPPPARKWLPRVRRAIPLQGRTQSKRRQ